MNEFPNNYNLEERTAKFGEEIIEFCRKLNQDIISKSIINQLIRSGTSIGANYMEANSASSKKDFKNKIYICKKESQETKYWIRMVTKYFPEVKNETEKLGDEVQELTLIFGKIISTINKNHSKLSHS